MKSSLRRQAPSEREIPAADAAASPLGVAHSSPQLDMNPQFRRALELLSSGHNVFITGKAGTGKSTLLSHFLATTDKQKLVAAPTGVAALNVDGITLHRLFSWDTGITVDQVKARGAGRYARALGKLDTLVIDEISMVRADLFDCVAEGLRWFGPHPGQEFGGVQLVLVGDPYQLPPVVSETEQEFFHTRYGTPYFFSADAWASFSYTVVELETVYRQHDDRFVHLLNQIRDGQADREVFSELNVRYDPAFEPDDGQMWMTLTTTNSLADSVNAKHLASLSAPAWASLAETTGRVDPAERRAPDSLEFKVGAQVMILVNHPQGAYANGTIGTVTDIAGPPDDPNVTIRLTDGTEHVFGRETWEIKRPTVQAGSLAYDVVGTYSQLPFKLAWAVTIHKSQGKTFERVMVNLGRGTFADGQLYVALSRATSLDGLVLKSQLRPHHVKVDQAVTRFLAQSKAAPAAALAAESVKTSDSGAAKLSTSAAAPVTTKPPDQGWLCLDDGQEIW